MKNLNIITSIVLILFFTSSFSMHWVFATPSEGCEIFDLKPGCDLSGWMKLIMGDLAIGAILALFLHYLSHRSNVKIEENIRIGIENSKNIQKIIIVQEESRNRRKIYVVQTLKNHFSSILLSIGLLNNFLKELEVDSSRKDHLDNLKRKEQEVKKILQHSRSTLDLSIDVFDPLFIDQIEKFFTQLDQIEVSDLRTVGFPNYEEIKEKISQLTKRLNDSLDSNEVLK